jgi:hypothetical protein
MVTSARHTHGDLPSSELGILMSHTNTGRAYMWYILINNTYNGLLTWHKTMIIILNISVLARYWPDAPMDILSRPSSTKPMHTSTTCRLRITMALASGSWLVQFDDSRRTLPTSFPCNFNTLLAACKSLSPTVVLYKQWSIRCLQNNWLVSSARHRKPTTVSTSIFKYLQTTIGKYISIAHCINT